MGKKLPSSASSGFPRLSVRLSEKGGNKLADIVLTNHGPGDVYELDAHPSADEDAGLYRDSDGLPVPKLPAGKSVVILQRFPAALAGRYKPYFNIVITAKTADGTTMELTEFVSGVN
jgi:hypothetical protein